MNYKLKKSCIIIALIMVFGDGIYFTNESNAQKKAYTIGGMGPAGGWIFYDKGNNSDGWRYLEAAPEDQSAKAEWDCFKKAIPGANGVAIGTGKSNTQAIVNNCGESNRAAKICTSYRGGGKSDWFLPSINELNLIYTNLHKAGIIGFSYVEYWSSSEINAIQAWKQNFGDGINDKYSKNSNGRVRAVRAF